MVSLVVATVLGQKVYMFVSLLALSAIIKYHCDI